MITGLISSTAPHHITSHHIDTKEVVELTKQKKYSCVVGTVLRHYLREKRQDEADELS
jgi:hypothetical protein